MKILKYVIALEILVAILTLGIVFGSNEAFGHEAGQSGMKYPAECCNKVDCQIISKADIEFTDKGYLYKPSGQIIPYEVAKHFHTEENGPYSPDHHFHACFYKNTAGYDPGKWENMIRQAYDDRNEYSWCFFAPMTGASLDK